jgi:hypothetical protein
MPELPLTPEPPLTSELALVLVEPELPFVLVEPELPFVLVEPELSPAVKGEPLAANSVPCALAAPPALSPLAPGLPSE